MLLLKKEMFDDGSNDCLNFFITPDDDRYDEYMVDWSYIKRCFNKYYKEVDKAIKEDEGYLEIPGCQITWG